MGKKREKKFTKFLFFRHELKTLHNFKQEKNISFSRCLNGTYLPPPLKQTLKRKAQLKSNI